MQNEDETMNEPREKSMTFKEIEGRIENFGKDAATYWGCAIAGEVGETCNILKKIERDGIDSKNKDGEKYIDLLPSELADVFIYTSLISRLFDIDLEKAIIDKLKVVESRRDKHE